MTDLTQMIRWNTSFVRGLAESVLNRAKVIRTSLGPQTKAKPVKKTSAKKTTKKAVRRAPKRRG